MSATPPRSSTSRPHPSAQASSAENGLLLDLYRVIVGPVNSAYYHQQFKRFEALGKPVPSWNQGAAFFTLAWLLLRKLWRPAGIYAAVLTAALLLWWAGLHGRVPLPVEAGLGLFLVMLLCAVPGLLGNALYYHSVRQQALHALSKSSTFAQARLQLQKDAPTTERFHTLAGAQAVVAAIIAGLVFHFTDWSALRSADTPASAAEVGPPDLVIPSVESLRAAQSGTTIAPSVALPLPPATLPAVQPEQELPPAKPQDTAPAAAPAPTPAPAPAPAAADKAKDKASKPSDGPELSIETFAKAVPATPEKNAPSAPAQAAAKSGAAAPTATPAPAVAPKPAAQAPATAAPAATNQLPPATANKLKQPSTPTPAPAKPVAPSAPASAPLPANAMVPGKYYLNAGVYAQEANVQRATQSLTRAKLPVLAQPVTGTQGKMTRLRIGPFDSREQALQGAASAKRLGIETSVFQQPRK